MKKRLRKKLHKKSEAAQRAAALATDNAPKSATLVAIECWRIKKLLPEFCENKKYLVLGSSIDKMLEALSQEGVEVDDPEGQEFRDGMTLDVALFEETAEIAANSRIVSETLSPTVYINNKLVQPARVIVSIGRKGE